MQVLNPPQEVGQFVVRTEVTFPQQGSTSSDSYRDQFTVEHLGDEVGYRVPLGHDPTNPQAENWAFLGEVVDDFVRSVR